MFDNLIQTGLDLATSNPVQFAGVSLLTVMLGAPTLRLTAWSVGGTVRTLFRGWKALRDDQAARAERTEALAGRAKESEREEMRRFIREQIGQKPLSFPAQSWGTVTTNNAPMVWKTTGVSMTASPATPSKSGQTPNPGEVKPGDVFKFVATPLPYPSTHTAGQNAQVGESVVAIKSDHNSIFYWGFKGRMTHAYFKDLVYA